MKNEIWLKKAKYNLYLYLFKLFYLRNRTKDKRKKRVIMSMLSLVLANIFTVLL